MSWFGPPKMEMVNVLSEAIQKSVVRLDPNKRYLLLVPTSMEEDEIEKFAKMLEDVLDISKSNLRVVVTNTKVRLLEF